MSERFAKLGCTLVLWDVNEKGLRETEELCKNQGAKCVSHTIDLCDREKVYQLADKVIMQTMYFDLLQNVE